MEIGAIIRYDPWMKSYLLPLIAMAIAVPTFAAEPIKNNGRLVYTAWECAKYAGLADKDDEASALFEVGLQAGRDFIKQVENEEIDEAYIRSNVPIGTSWVVFEGGPTTDFILGRLQHSVSTDAYDNVVKKDSAGLPLKVGEWNLDRELQKMIAENLYSKGNCSLFVP